MMRDSKTGRPRPSITPSRKTARKRKRPRMYDRVLKGSKNMPSVFKRGNIYFLVESEASQYRIPRNIIITIAIVFFCALVSVLTHAQITAIDTQITQANRDIRALTNERRVHETRLIGRYSIEEIEFYAFMRLGMSHPDPSQIIEINVPAQDSVVLNREEALLPRQNYFWLDIRRFISGSFNRIFGGG